MYNNREVIAVTQLYRTQILLERQQHESLQALAAAEGRSMSEIIREAVAEYLIERDEDSQRQRDLDWLDELVKLREEIRAESGDFPEELLLDFRAEREEELWQRMLGE
jgi:hypothetical protein